jgi:hypothetical protein
LNDDHIVSGRGVTTDTSSHGVYYLPCCSNETTLSVALEYQLNHTGSSRSDRSISRGSSSSRNGDYEVVLLQFAYSYETMIESDDLIVNGSSRSVDTTAASSVDDDDDDEDDDEEDDDVNSDVKMKNDCKISNDNDNSTFRSSNINNDDDVDGGGSDLYHHHYHHQSYYDNLMSIFDLTNINNKINYYYNKTNNKLSSHHHHHQANNHKKISSSNNKSTKNYKNSCHHIDIIDDKINGNNNHDGGYDNNYHLITVKYLRIFTIAIECSSSYYVLFNSLFASTSSTLLLRNAIQIELLETNKYNYDNNTFYVGSSNSNIRSSSSSSGGNTTKSSHDGRYSHVDDIKVEEVNSILLNNYLINNNTTTSTSSRSISYVINHIIRLMISYLKFETLSKDNDINNLDQYQTIVAQSLQDIIRSKLIHKYLLRVFSIINKLIVDYKRHNSSSSSRSSSNNSIDNHHHHNTSDFLDDHQHHQQKQHHDRSFNHTHRSRSRSCIIISDHSITLSSMINALDDYNTDRFIFPIMIAVTDDLLYKGKNNNNNNNKMF